MKKIILPALIALFLSGCASQSEFLRTERPIIRKNPYQEAVSLLYYSMGYLADLQGNYDTAEENMLISAKYAYEPGTVYLDLADIRQKKGVGELAKETIAEGVEKDPWHPDLLVAAAKQLIEKEDYVKAKQMLTRAIELDPMLSEAYFYMGVVNYRTGSADIAESDFLKSVSLMEKAQTSAAYYNVGYIYVAKKDYNKAIEFMNKAIEADGGYLKAYDAIAKIREEQGDIEGAANAYRQYLKLYPADADIMGLIAELYYRSGRPDDAEKEYREIIKSNPEAYDAMFSIGQIKMKLEKYDEALKLFGGIEKKKPDNVNVKYFTALCLERMKKSQQALDKFREVVKLDSSNINAYFHIGYMMDALGKLKDIVPEFELLVESNPDKEDYYHLLASVHGDLKDYAKAAEIYEKAKLKFPDSEKIFFNSGFIYDKLKARDKAVEAFRQVIKLNPKNPEPYNYIGYTYADNNEKLDEAMDLVNKALALEPGNGYYLDSLGWVYFKKGMYKEAVTTLEASVAAVAKEEKKSDATILEHLGDAYVKTGNKDKALEIYNKALEMNEDNAESVRSKINSLGGSGN